MVTLRNPEAPASSRQLYRLQQLTKQNTSDWEMTMQEASDMISKLEGKELTSPMPLPKRPEANKPSYQREPFTEAHVTIIEGDQRGGKTNTAVAKIVDSYHNDCVKIYCENVLKIKCEVKSYDRKTRIARIKYNGGIRRIQVPKDYKLQSPMRIFSNVVLYGIPHFFCPTFNHILDWLKKGYIINCWLLVDESYVGMSARTCMRALGRELANQYWQFGKMQLDVIIISPMAKLIDWELRTIPTEHIHCSYNDRIRKITLAIRKKGIKGEKKVTYDGTQYWKYFDTNQRITA